MNYGFADNASYRNPAFEITCKMFTKDIKYYRNTRGRWEIS
jgi:hypothetical protein